MSTVGLTVAQGTLVQLNATFQTGTPPANTDPGSVTFTVEKPDGTTVSPATVKDGVGLYHAILDTSTGVVVSYPGGIFTWKAVGTAPVQLTLDAHLLNTEVFVKAPGY